MPKKRRPKLYEDMTTSRDTPQEQETRVATLVGGRTQPGSGSKDHAKGDVLQAAREAGFRLDSFLIECLTHEAPVMVGPGEFRPISEISVGDKVVDDRGDLREVRNVFQREYEGELICVKSSGDSRIIRMTPEHPVLVFDEKMKESFVKSGELSGGYVFWHSVCREDGAIRRVNMDPKYGNGRKPFPKAIDVDGDLARFCGLFVAEGHVSQGKVFFTLHIDEEGYSEDLSEVGGRVFWDTGAETLRPDNNVRVRGFYNASMSEFLGNTCGLGAHNKRVPEFILHGDRSVKIEFLLGLFSGDGYSCSTSTGFTTVSWGLAYQVRDMLLSLGIAAGVGPGSKTSAQVRVFGSQMERFSEEVGFGFRRGKCRKGRYFCLDDEPGLMLSRFSVSREMYSGLVFNLEVEEREVFVCGSMVVHNCKQTEKASMSIKGAWLAKITREAMAAGREPLLEFEIQGCEDPMLEREWVAMPMSVFRRMTEGE